MPLSMTIREIGDFLKRQVQSRDAASLKMFLP